MCRICDGEGCLNCDPNPDNICKCGNPDCDGTWTDPAGGVHSCGEPEPWRLYE